MREKATTRTMDGGREGSTMRARTCAVVAVMMTVGADFEPTTRAKTEGERFRARVFDR